MALLSALYPSRWRRVQYQRLSDTPKETDMAQDREPLALQYVSSTLPTSPFILILRKRCTGLWLIDMDGQDARRVWQRKREGHWRWSPRK